MAEKVQTPQEWFEGRRLSQLTAHHSRVTRSAGNSPAEFAAIVKKDLERRTAVIKRGTFARNRF
jgi:hypothetical protein